MSADKMTPRLLEKYKSAIVPKMMEKFRFTNTHQVPRLIKIVVNVGLSEALQDKKFLESVMSEIGVITGQKPVETKAKKAIAGFKIKKGSLVGCKVTLRRARMYEFLDRLINVAIPRIRDFRGLSADAFDERGNYSLGITEQGIFPEIEMDKIQIVHGMDITIVTNLAKKEESRELLRFFGMPFKK